MARTLWFVVHDLVFIMMIVVYDLLLTITFHWVLLNSQSIMMQRIPTAMQRDNKSPDCSCCSVTVWSLHLCCSPTCGLAASTLRLQAVRRRPGGRRDLLATGELARDLRARGPPRAGPGLHRPRWCEGGTSLGPGSGMRRWNSGLSTCEPELSEGGGRRGWFRGSGPGLGPAGRAPAVPVRAVNAREGILARGTARPPT